VDEHRDQAVARVRARDGRRGCPGRGTPSLLSSFSPQALAAAREAAPELARGYLVDRVPADWRERLDALGCVALHVNHRHLTAAAAEAVTQAGYGLFCYTVNDPVRVDTLFGWGVDALCTDRIDRVQPD
jgi:glycerophosphoryl diester phosphodiesterase